MKRTIILGTAAFVFAVGSAFVSKGRVNGMSNDLYMQSTVTPNECIISTCNLTSLQPCDIQSYLHNPGTGTCTSPVASFKD